MVENKRIKRPVVWHDFFPRSDFHAVPESQARCKSPTILEFRIVRFYNDGKSLASTNSKDCSRAQGRDDGCAHRMAFFQGIGAFLRHPGGGANGVAW